MRIGALSLMRLFVNQYTLQKQVYSLPVEIDEEIARLKLEAMGGKIDTATEYQSEYLSSWEEGT